MSTPTNKPHTGTPANFAQMLDYIASDLGETWTPAQRSLVQGYFKELLAHKFTRAMHENESVSLALQQVFQKLFD